MVLRRVQVQPEERPSALAAHRSAPEMASAQNTLHPTPCTRHPTFYTLKPIHYTTPGSWKGLPKVDSLSLFKRQVLRAAVRDPEQPYRGNLRMLSILGNI